MESKGTTIAHFIPDPHGFKNRIVMRRGLYVPLSAGAGNQVSPLGIPKVLEKLESLRDRNIVTEEEFQEKKKLLASLWSGASSRATPAGAQAARAVLSPLFDFRTALPVQP